MVLDKITAEFSVAHSFHGSVADCPSFPSVSGVPLKTLIDKLGEAGFGVDVSNSELVFDSRLVRGGSSFESSSRVPLSVVNTGGDFPSDSRLKVLGYTLRNNNGHTELDLIDYDNSRSAAPEGVIGGPVNYDAGIMVRISCFHDLSPEAFNRLGTLRKAVYALYSPVGRLIP